MYVCMRMYILLDQLQWCSHFVSFIVNTLARVISFLSGIFICEREVFAQAVSHGSLNYPQFFHSANALSFCRLCAHISWRVPLCELFQVSKLHLFTVLQKPSESVGCEIFAGAIHLLLISRARLRVIFKSVNIPLFLAVFKRFLLMVCHTFVSV